MGLSFSLLSSAWNEILGHRFYDLTDTVETFIARSISFGSKEGELILMKSHSFKNKDMEKPQKSEKEMLKTHVPLKELVVDNENETSDYSEVKKSKPEIPFPVQEPFVFSSPRPVNELNSAATTLQKVYKSYRTRRNLADCAVVVEELWWKTLDSAALKQSSISFFNKVEHETAVSRWARARTRAAKVGKGLSKDEKAQKLALQHWLEAIDPRHRYGHNLHFYYDVWSESKSFQPFFYWLDVGDGKEINLERCPRVNLHRQCIEYLAPKQREKYEVIVDEGKLAYKQSGFLLNTAEGSKWIFVLSTSRTLYVAQKRKGVFQHSSFLSGAATTAAGRLVAHHGILEVQLMDIYVKFIRFFLVVRLYFVYVLIGSCFLQAIWPYSGHYLPTEDNFKEFIMFLGENHVDLTNVKRCAIDDDRTSFKEDAIKVEGPDNNALKAPRAGSTSINTANIEAPKLDLPKTLSCKWTSGVGPRIGCVRDYPMELQSEALERVNLSPTTTPGQPKSCLPIPSPRPSPKIRMSPRLAYMGLPSPRVSLRA
ncbi:Hypothetical predicted protein [Olea europaea subsp. europaea]|uniref:Uncharacterized protein n=1 Tax=Olea europaea subsp. europaea TaxID=158383 RepID=A0A8S0Q061_OLEEU|nr:Hypothetical predicted protein [Olea europaea subsp. europaea]